MQAALSELLGAIRGIGAIREELKIAREHVDMKQKEMEMDKIKSDLEQKRVQLEKMREELKRLQKQLTTFEAGIKKIREKKGMTDRLRCMDQLVNIVNERDKKQEELNTKQKELELIEKETNKNKSVLDELYSKKAKWQYGEEITEKQTKLQNSLLAVSKLKILQFGFIDDQIRSRLESSLKEIYSFYAERLLELESTVSDTLDDIRLLAWETLERECSKGTLSVRKLCSDPNMKVISTQNSLQKHLLDSIKVLKLDNEQSGHILDNTNVLTLPGVLLESDILEVSNVPYSFPDPVTAAVKINATNASLFDYQIVLESDKGWENITVESQEGYIKFPFRRMKHLFVISTEKWKVQTLGSEGLYYKSVEVENVTVSFPPCNKNKCDIQFQVIPPNPIQQTAIQDSDAATDPHVGTDIISMSPRLWIKHDGGLIFQKPIVVTLPLPSAPPTEQKTELGVVIWTDDDNMHILDTNIRVNENVCEFEVEEFSGASLVRTRQRRNIARMKHDIRQCYTYERGLPIECRVVTFSDKSAVNTLWIQIVESKKVDELKLRFQQQQLIEIANTISPPIKFRHGQIIKIIVLGSIRIHPDLELDHMQIEFMAREANDRKRFYVEIIDSNACALLKFLSESEELHFCNFEAIEWLRQRVGTTQPKKERERRENAHRATNITLNDRSILALARHIPPRQTEELATELNLSHNEVADFKAQRYEGLQLTVQVLCKWRQKSDEEASDMIYDLATALNRLALRNLASKLLNAATERRSLVDEDFAE